MNCKRRAASTSQAIGPTALCLWWGTVDQHASLLERFVQLENKLNPSRENSKISRKSGVEAAALLERFGQ